MKSLKALLIFFFALLPGSASKAAVQVQIVFGESQAQEDGSAKSIERVLSLGALQRISIHSAQAAKLFSTSKEVVMFLEGSKNLPGARDAAASGSDLSILSHALDDIESNGAFIELQAENGGCYLFNQFQNRRDVSAQVSLFQSLNVTAMGSASTTVSCIQVPDDDGNVISLPEIAEKKMPAGHYIATSEFMIESNFAARR